MAPSLIHAFSTNSLVKFLCLLCVANFAGAQTRAPRALRETKTAHVEFLGEEAGSVTGSVRCSAKIDAGGLLTDVWGNSVATGVATPGDIFLFFTGDNDKYENVLVCGMNSFGCGVVEHWKKETFKDGSETAEIHQIQGQPMTSGWQDFEIGRASCRERV